MATKTFKLNNGYEMPVVGLGTWQLNDYEKLENSITTAVKIGYRHIDAAFIYLNEPEIGKILKKLFDRGIVKREELFITSKLWNSYHNDPRKALEKTLKDLQLDYIDLYLIHWPITYKVDVNHKPIIENGKNLTEEFDVVKIWKHLESFVKGGKVRSIGLCNSDQSVCDKILSNCEIKPQIAQFELHPYLSREDWVKYYQKNGIGVVSYSSLGSTQKNNLEVIKDPVITRLAEKYKRSPSQIILSYIVMRKIFIIPKSTNPKHIKENYEVLELDKKDFEEIRKLNKDMVYIHAPLQGIEI